MAHPSTNISIEFEMFLDIRDHASDLDVRFSGEAERDGISETWTFVAALLDLDTRGDLPGSHPRECS